MSESRIDCIADTSAVVGLVRRHRRTVDVMEGRKFAITFVTVAELYLGVFKANSWAAAVARLNEVIPEQEVFYPSSATAAIYARICHGQEQKGSRIPTNDIWIAAIAVENGLPLVGRDEHFTRIEELTFISC